MAPMRRATVPWRRKARIRRTSPMRSGTDGEIFLVIREGAGPKMDMKGYKSKMSETDVWNVVNFLRSLAK